MLCAHHGCQSFLQGVWKCRDGRHFGFLQVLCLADINRAGSQAERGGGAMCFAKNVPMWEAFNAIITQEEACITAEESNGINTKKKRKESCTNE